VRRPTLVRQEGNLGSGYKNTDLKWSRKRIELSPEVIVQFHRGVLCLQCVGVFTAIKDVISVFFLSNYKSRCL